MRSVTLGKKKIHMFLIGYQFLNQQTKNQKRNICRLICILKWWSIKKDLSWGMQNMFDMGEILQILHTHTLTLTHVNTPSFMLVLLKCNAVFTLLKWTLPIDCSHTVLCKQRRCCLCRNTWIYQLLNIQIYMVHINAHMYTLPVKHLGTSNLN